MAALGTKHPFWNSGHGAAPGHFGAEILVLSTYSKMGYFGTVVKWPPLKQNTHFGIVAMGLPQAILGQKFWC